MHEILLREVELHKHSYLVGKDKLDSLAILLAKEFPRYGAAPRGGKDALSNNTCCRRLWMYEYEVHMKNGTLELVKKWDQKWKILQVVHGHTQNKEGLKWWSGASFLCLCTALHHLIFIRKWMSFLHVPNTTKHFYPCWFQGSSCSYFTK